MQHIQFHGGFEVADAGFHVPSSQAQFQEFVRRVFLRT
jgi:hypothetical protein